MPRKTSLIFACVLCCVTAAMPSVVWGASCCSGTCGIGQNECCPGSGCMHVVSGVGTFCSTDGCGGGGGDCMGFCQGQGGSYADCNCACNSIGCPPSFTCPAGSCPNLWAGGACVQLAAGYWSAGGTFNINNASNCPNECADNQYSAPGSTSSSACTSCPSGYRRDCKGAAASSTPSGQDSCKSCQCSAGYYGDGVTSCNPCPNITAQGWSPSMAGSSAAGTMAITDCYIPSGTTGMSDGTGTFTAGANCQYQL